MTPSPHDSPSIHIGEFSDIGQRPNQEDRYRVAPFQTRDGRPGLLALVADGIGGQNTGELASNIIWEVVPEFIESTQPTASEMTSALVAALEEANRRIYEESLQNMNRAGMGSTCTAVAIVDKRLYLAHVGDSRAYLLHRGQLRQLTIDHTWAEEALRHGRSPEEIRNHPNRGVLKRFLGIDPEVEVDTRYKLSSALDDYQDAREKPLYLEDDDTIMLCTDGVSDVLSEEEIAAILQKYPADQAARALVRAAKQAGATDNLTAVVLDMPEAQKQGGGPLPQAAVVGVAALILILLVGLGFFFWSRGKRSSASAPLTPIATTMPATPTPSTANASLPPQQAPESGVVIAIDTPEATPTEALAATRAPTPTPIPTFTPTPTRAIIAPSSQPSSPGTRPTPAIGSSEEVNIRVLPVEPAPGALLNNRFAHFRWRIDSGALSSDQQFELVFYPCDKNAMRYGFSPVNSTRETSLDVDLVVADNNPHLGFDVGKWCWGVIVGHFQGNQWIRDKFVSKQGVPFTYQRPSNNPPPPSPTSSPSSSPTPPPHPPTPTPAPTTSPPTPTPTPGIED